MIKIKGEAGQLIGEEKGNKDNEGVSESVTTMSSHRTSISDVGEPVKVIFELEPSDWHDYATESVWAIPLGDNKYRVKNVPFYAYGLSYDDIVLARPNEDGQLIVHDVRERGGHSTYRVILNSGTTDKDFENAWNKLGYLGSTYERATDRLIAVDVPPETDIYEAYAALESGEQDNVWDFEEAHCGHPLKKSEG